MSIDDARVTKKHNGDYLVSISHGRYPVGHNERDNLWWAFSRACDGRRLDRADDPLSCSSDACSGWGTAEELVAVLLTFDGQAAPA